jgi:hypothetical protein
MRTIGLDCRHFAIMSLNKVLYVFLHRDTVPVPHSKVATVGPVPTARTLLSPHAALGNADQFAERLEECLCECLPPNVSPPVQCCGEERFLGASASSGLSYDPSVRVLSGD